MPTMDRFNSNNGSDNHITVEEELPNFKDQTRSVVIDPTMSSTTISHHTNKDSTSSSSHHVNIDNDDNIPIAQAYYGDDDSRDIKPAPQTSSWMKTNPKVCIVVFVCMIVLVIILGGICGSGSCSKPNTYNTCGNGIVGNGICSDTKLCCSNFGYCGSSTEYCNATMNNETLQQSYCGDGIVGNTICMDMNLCCSKFGYCGSTDEYCSTDNIATP